MVVADEDVRFAIGQPVIDLHRRARHDEQFAAIDLDLGHLVRRQGVLDRQRMQFEAIDQNLDLGVRGIVKADPYELTGLQRQPLGRQRRLSHALTVAIDVGGDDGHAGFRDLRGSRPALGQVSAKRNGRRIAPPAVRFTNALKSREAR